MDQDCEEELINGSSKKTQQPRNRVMRENSTHKDTPQFNGSNGLKDSVLETQFSDIPETGNQQDIISSVQEKLSNSGAARGEGNSNPLNPMGRTTPRAMEPCASSIPILAAPIQLVSGFVMNSGAYKKDNREASGSNPVAFATTKPGTLMINEERILKTIGEGNKDLAAVFARLKSMPNSKYKMKQLGSEGCHQGTVDGIPSGIVKEEVRDFDIEAFDRQRAEADKEIELVHSKMADILAGQSAQASTDPNLRSGAKARKQNSGKKK